MEQEKKKRTVQPITKWEVEYIELVNAELSKRGWSTNNLARELGSYNYDNFKEFFLNQNGQFRSRTIGKVNELLGIKTVVK
jgi:ribosome-binding protein aMBF1 (putative translation factor)